jgi:peptidoglycan hydrolase-like protein with peptidoglycan-binding domain
MVLATAASLSLATAAYAQQEQDPAAEDTQKVEQPQRGSNGMQMDPETVRQVQQALKDKGHDPGPVDGIVGKRTSKALKDFQKAEGLQPTGKLDSETMAVLGMENGSTASSDSAASDTGEASPQSSSSQSPSSQSPGTPTDRNHPQAQGGDAGQAPAGGQQSQ